MLAFRVNRQRRLLWLLSLVALLLSLLGMAISWSRPDIGAPLRPGLDFTGGSQIQIERRCESSCPALSVAAPYTFHFQNPHGEQCLGTAIGAGQPASAAAAPPAGGRCPQWA